jgi:hypothetical protein
MDAGDDGEASSADKVGSKQYAVSRKRRWLGCWVVRKNKKPDKANEHFVLSAVVALTYHLSPKT